MTEGTNKDALLGNDDNIAVKVIRAGANVREIVKDAAFAELVESVREFGVLEPILVRPVGGEDAEFEVIAGQRRFAAAKLAKMERVPVRVFKVTDDVAEQIQAVENMHRANLDPIQEAVAIKKVQARTGDVRLTSAVMKKTIVYVHRSLALLDLPESVTKLIASGELTAAHGHEIARVEEKARPAVITFALERDWAKKLPDLESLRAKIAAKVVNDLKKAPFVKDEVYAGLVACTACPLNTANQVSLFEGAVDGQCTGPSCFSKKERQFYKDFAETHGKKLESFKALGSVSDRGNHAIGATTCKGFPIIPEDVLESKVYKKAMEDKPEAFGWAVVKPSEWSEKKKPSVAFFLVDPSVLPKEKQPAAPAKERDFEAEQKKENHFQRYRTSHLLAAAARAFNGKQEQLVGMAWRAARGDANDMSRALGAIGILDRTKVKTEKDLANFVDKMKPSDLMRAMWVLSFETWQLARRLKEIGLDTAKIVKNADGEAALAWESGEAKEKAKPVDAGEKKKG